MVKVLLSQSLDYELSRVELYNRLIEGGVQIYGADFLQNLNHILSGFRNTHYRPVRTCHIRPSRDLYGLALETLRRAPGELELPGLAGRLAGWMMRTSAVAGSELLSYLMFTPTYLHELLALGERDARASRDRLLRFFAEEASSRESAMGTASVV
jgi:NTE family protein